MINYFYSNARARQITTVEEAKAGVWVHATEPSEEELNFLAKKFSLERDLLDDAIDIYEAPRAEIDGKDAYVFTRYCHPDGKDIATEPLLIIYTSDNIITIMRKDDSVLDRIITGGLEVLTTQRTKIFLHILEQINHSYKIQLHQVTKRILQIRSKLRQSEITNFEFVSFIELEEDLNEFLGALQPQQAVLLSLRTGRYMRLYEEDKDLIEDLTLSTTELIEMTKSRLRTLVNVRQAYDTIATNNLNRIFKRLTSIGIFLSVPMVVGGLWGMNVAVPFKDNPHGFSIVTTGTVIATIITVYYFHKHKWL